jgi:zinc and cadmium transporter
MNTIWIVLFWSFIGGVVSLSLGAALITKESLRKRMMLYAVPFGAGALLATAFTNTLPEALEGGADAHSILIYALIGFLSFFVLERLAGWLHGHHEHGRSRAQSSMVVVGDTLHNVIDGVAIGIAFLVDVPTGIITSLAVAAHELPQEVGDFGILLSRGIRPGKVLLINVLSGLGTVVAAVLTFSLGSDQGWQLGYALAIAAGFFIYIAASDIIPEIHESPRRLANIQAAILLVGVLVLFAVGTLIPHSDHGNKQPATTEQCVSQEALNTMGAPAPGTTLPPVCH